MLDSALHPGPQQGTARSFCEVLLPSAALKNLVYSLWGYSTVFTWESGGDGERKHQVCAWHVEWQSRATLHSHHFVSSHPEGRDSESHKRAALRTQGDMAAGNLEAKKGEDLAVKGSLESIDVFASDGVVEDDLPTVMIHIDTHFLKTDLELLLRFTVGEWLARSG